MDHGPMPAAGLRHLTGVSKTLRRLYGPAHEPNARIERALDALADLDCRTERLSRPARSLAPAA